MSIQVIKPGAFSSFQDLGRIGHQQLGVPVGGVMDEVSHRLANWTVGNAEDEATLEITLLGPMLRFDVDAVIAWCGADLSATLDGTALPRAMPVAVPAGATLQFGKRVSGLRTYLALRGGVVLDRVMGSTSTYARAGFGGHGGRALRKGDVLTLKSPGAPAGVPQPAAATTDALEALLDGLDAATDAPIRVLPGREWGQFSDAMHEALLSQRWRIGAQSERMGYRLEGQPLQRSTTGDILSEAVSFGAMQVPPNGQPIVLMAERQTTGGYPKIAQVASVDLPRLAQCAPGEFVQFELIDIERAQALLLDRARALQALRTLQTLQTTRP